MSREDRDGTPTGTKVTHVFLEIGAMIMPLAVGNGIFSSTIPHPPVTCSQVRVYSSARNITLTAPEMESIFVSIQVKYIVFFVSIVMTCAKNITDCENASF